MIEFESQVKSCGYLVHICDLYKIEHFKIPLSLWQPNFHGCSFVQDIFLSPFKLPFNTYVIGIGECNITTMLSILNWMFNDDE